MALHLRVAGPCNLDCVFCSWPERGLAFDLKASAARAARSRERHVQVSGGEPLAAPRAGLAALCGWLKARGRLVELQTNGTLVDGLPEAYLRRLARSLDAFNVNFSAPDARLDAAVTRRRGAFAARERGVDRLCGLGPPVRLTYVVCALNMAAAPGFPAYVARRFPRVGWLQFSFVKGQGRAAGRADLVPTHAEAAPYLKQALRAAERLGLRAEVDHVPACALPDFLARLVDTHKLRRGLPGVHRTEKRQVPACAGCPLGAQCPGPRADYRAIHGF